MLAHNLQCQTRLPATEMNALVARSIVVPAPSQSGPAVEKLGWLKPHLSEARAEEASYPL